MSLLPRDRVTALCARTAAECACEGLRRAARATSRLYAAALAPFSLTATQLAILVAARLGGGVPLSRLAERLALDRTSLYRAVRPLQRRGYLRLGPGRTQRERRATLTAKGERLLQEALPIWETTQQRFVAAMGSRAWSALSSALAHVVPVARILRSTAPRRPPRRRIARSG
jgi:DNA-binding MarR family transcriptional regulator